MFSFFFFWHLPPSSQTSALSIFYDQCRLHLIQGCLTRHIYLPRSSPPTPSLSLRRSEFKAQHLNINTAWHAVWKPWHACQCVRPSTAEQEEKYWTEVETNARSSLRFILWEQGLLSRFLIHPFSMGFAVAHSWQFYNGSQCVGSGSKKFKSTTKYVHMQPSVHF